MFCVARLADRTAALLAGTAAAGVGVLNVVVAGRDRWLSFHVIRLPSGQRKEARAVAGRSQTTTPAALSHGVVSCPFVLRQSSAHTEGNLLYRNAVIFIRSVQQVQE